MKKVFFVSLMFVAGAVQAECDRERKVLARSDIQGETRLVWEKQLAECLENVEKQKELIARLDAEAKARAEEEAEKKKQRDARWNSFKEPKPGSGTYSRDTYARAIGRNKIIEEEFGDQCPVLSKFQKEQGAKFDEICLKARSGFKYEDSRTIEMYKKMADDEPALVAAMTKAKAESDRRAKLPGVRIGMTAEQVINNSSWGRPSEINRTTTAHGTREQWVYGSRNYLYFTNGVLTAIQN